MQFSIKSLLIVQAVLAVIVFLGRNGALLPIGMILSLVMWFVAAVWGTIRIAGRQGSDNLFFYPAKRPDSEEKTRELPEDTARFLEVVKSSGLLTADQVDDFPNYFTDQEWESLSKNPKEVAEQMVEQELLTRWQADLLVHGKYKGFFLNHYKLLKHLGSGRTCGVYLAENRFHKQVALKVLPKNLAEAREEMARFIRKAQLPGLLDHPRFIEPHDIDQANDTHYMVQEYEPGQDLQQFIKEQGPLAPLTTIKYLAQVADGVARIHHFDLVHRDLRPEHLLLTEAHGLKITGLTLTVSIERAREEKVDAQTKYFESLDYLAPELVFDHPSVGPASDIYSLGCIG